MNETITQDRLKELLTLDPETVPAYSNVLDNPVPVLHRALALERRF
jgi:hypothetical protein